MPECPKSNGILPNLVWGGPELSVLRMLGLFDRPADEKALGALLKPPAIRGLTESLIDLSPTEWRTILAKLRRARLLAGEEPLLSSAGTPAAGNLEGNGTAVFSRHLRLPGRFVSRCVARSLPAPDPAGQCLLCRKGSWG